jgi:hypothetical protein
MTPGAPDVQSPHDVPGSSPAIYRERVVVRRRRAKSQRRHQHRSWTARASRRRIIRAFVVYTGVLVLMALGLYFGLSRQEVSPAEGSLKKTAVALSVHRA